MLKLFDNCKELLILKNGKNLIGMMSDEGEEYFFLEA
jgi:hypothetical protein